MDYLTIAILLVAWAIIGFILTLLLDINYIYARVWKSVLTMLVLGGPVAVFMMGCSLMVEYGIKGLAKVRKTNVHKRFNDWLEK